MTTQWRKKSSLCLAAWLLSGLVGMASAGLAQTASDAVTAAPVGAIDPLAAAHFSLSLRHAPLPRMLTLLEQTTGLHFRYATPPDTVVDTSFSNAPLLPTLTTLLGNEGFAMQRTGYEIFLFRAAAPAVALTRPAAWSYWKLPTPPPAEWIIGQTLPVPGAVPTPDEWQVATLQPQWAQRPGVAVTLPHATNATSAPADGPVWLRWTLLLRHLPTGAQLLLETPAEANVYVNGAPLLRRWQGKRLLDLSHVLHVGLNCLALYWPHTPPPLETTSTAPATPAPALLNYEWFFAATPPIEPKETQPSPRPPPSASEF